MAWDLNKLRDWQRRLSSSDEKTRFKAMEELMTYGFIQLDDRELERYVREDLSVLRDFVLSAKLNSTFVGWITKGEIVKILRINWPMVESLLLRWTSLRDVIQRQGKGKILDTPTGQRWLYGQTHSFYTFLKVLCYTTYCPRCNFLVDALKPMVAKWDEGKRHVIGIYHLECLIPKKELVEMAKTLPKRQDRFVAS
jgi:hypothetical protein